MSLETPCPRSHNSPDILPQDHLFAVPPMPWCVSREFSVQFYNSLYYKELTLKTGHCPVSGQLPVSGFLLKSGLFLCVTIAQEYVYPWGFTSWVSLSRYKAYIFHREKINTVNWDAT